MNKIIKSLLIILIILLIWSSASFAAALMAEIDITQDKTEAIAGDTVTFTLKLTNVQNAEGGIVSAIAGKVEYDKDFYEDLVASDFTLNEETGKFSRLGSFKNDSVIGTMSLKVKSNATGSGNVTFTELAANDGRDDIEESEAETEDKTFTVEIAQEPTSPTPTPEVDEPTPTPEADEPTPTPEADEPTPTPEADEPTPTPEAEEPTPTSSGNVIIITPEPSPDIKSGASTSTNTTKEVSKLPKTGEKISIIFAILISTSVAYITYRKFNKYKGI